MTAANKIYPYYGPERPSAIFYDIVEGAHRPVAPEVAFYLEMARGIKTPILELGCGTGRVAWELAKAGHEVVGVDNALPVLERARKKQSDYARDVGSRIRFEMGDICNIELDEKFSLILAPYRVFNHLVSEQEQLSFLANVKRHLARGGRCVFDTVQPTLERLQAGPDYFQAIPPFIIDVDHLGMKLERRIVDNSADMQQQTFASDYCYIMKMQSGELHEHVDRLHMRWVSDEQMKEMLKQSGLRVISFFKDFTKSKPDEIGDRVWVVEVSGQ